MAIPNSMLEKILRSGVKLTPMMSQYFSIKKEYPDILLFFRMGDFYELFFDDAVFASKTLNITLTHRGKLGDIPIPMAGIPYHSANSYVDRLTSQGLKVAICEQVEDPKEAQGIVKRQVTQIVSPGMPFDLEKSDSSEFRFLSSGAFLDGQFFLALLDFTTGEFLGIKCDHEKEFIEKLSLFSPREFITHMGQWEEFPQILEVLEQRSILKTHLSSEYFNEKISSLYIEKLIPSFRRDEVIKLNAGILSPIGALSYYICSTQIVSELYHIRPFRMEGQNGHMKVTLPTLKGLEILPKSRETYRDSLLGFMDRTKTSMGSRELKYIFQTPLADGQEITARQNVLAYFLERSDLLSEIRELLSEIRDLERILAKVSTKKVTSQDLINLSLGINHYKKMITKLAKLPGRFLHQISRKEFSSMEELAKKIRQTLNEAMDASLEKGNLIREGMSKERDRLAAMSGHSAEELLKLESKYRKSTGIPNLKIKFNNISGHFIEVSKSYLSKVPKSFERRQTLVNSERFVTKELLEFEKEIVSAKDRLQNLEKKIFEDLVQEVSQRSSLIIQVAKEIGTLDVFQSFAHVALQEEFVRPQISPAKKILQVKGAWHPLIKSILKDEFVTHDLLLNEKKYFGLITGPNMAGKTTVMREMSIIQFLAQIGSFVPAREAHLGLCDYLFSRLGASDDIQRGQSTFMVEMSETAEILRHATDKSLIIMDEVGRGTSTFDGLSIAWALVEHFIQKTKAFTLFSTHYHELIEVVEKFPAAKNLTVETIVNQGEVQFLYRLIEGATTQSYGIFVAQLAGLSQGILHKAQEILESLEDSGHKRIKNEFIQAGPGTGEKSKISKGKVPSLASNGNGNGIENGNGNGNGGNNRRSCPSKKYHGIQLCFFPNEQLSPEVPTFHDVEDDGTSYMNTTEQASTSQVPNHLKELESDLLSLDVMNMTPLQALEKLHHLQKSIQLQ